MTWLIDDVNLSTLAFNVEQRSAGWKVPAKRGDNLVIPGRDGAQWVPNKPFDVGSIVLSMWAVGATEDGLVPSVGSQTQIRANLDKLTALFAQSQRLLNVVQISSQAYGVRNYFLNPSFGATQGSDAVTYTNSIPNPSARGVDDDVQMTNLFPNPNASTVEQVIDPSRVNLAPTPHLDYGLGSFTASGSLTFDTVVDTDVSTRASLRLTPGGAQTSTSAYPLGYGGAGVILAKTGLHGGDTVTVSATIKVNAVQTGTLDSRARMIAIGTITGGTTNYSFAYSAAAANVAGTVARLSVTFTIPTTVDDFFIRLMNGSANPAETILWNQVLIEKTSSVLGYFDGDFPATSDTSYAWSGTPGNSPSNLIFNRNQIDVPLGYGNFNGGYTLTDKSWGTRVPLQVNLIISNGLDLFVSSELHEENDLHTYFLSQLTAVDRDWALASGSGGIHMFYRPSKYTAPAPITVPFTKGKVFVVFTVRLKINGFTATIIGNDFRVNDSDGTSRADERADETKQVLAYIAANTLPNLIVLGHLRTRGGSPLPDPRAQFAAAGWLTVKQRGAVTNGDHASDTGATGVEWTEDIYTRSDVGVSDSSLIPTNGASDHWGWIATTITYNINTVLGYVSTYDNVYLDPSSQFTRGNALSTIYNYWTPSNLEGYTLGSSLGSTYFTVASNTTATVQSLTSADQTAEPYAGTRGLRILSTAALAANAALGTKRPMNISSSGARPLLRLTVRRTQSGTSVRTIQIRLSTTDSSGNVGQTGDWQTTTLPTSNATWVDATYTSPTILIPTFGSPNIIAEFRTGEAWSSGDGVMITQPILHGYGATARVSTSVTPGPYFDGASPWIDAHYTTDGQATTPSQWDLLLDPRWVADSAGSAYYGYVQTPRQDPLGTSLSFHAMGLSATGTQSFTVECDKPTYPGQPYALRFLARAINGLTPTVELLKKTTSDASPVSLGSVSVAGTAVSATTTMTESLPPAPPPKGLQEFARLKPQINEHFACVAMDPVTQDIYTIQTDGDNPLNDLWLSRFDASNGYKFASLMTFGNGGHGGDPGTLVVEHSSNGTVYCTFDYRRSISDRSIDHYWIRVPYTAGASLSKSDVDSANYKVKSYPTSGASKPSDGWWQGEVKFEDTFYRLYGPPSSNSPKKTPALHVIKNKKIVEKISLGGLGRTGAKSSGSLIGGRMEPEGISVMYQDNYPLLLIGGQVNKKSKGYELQTYTYALPYSGNVVSSAPTTYTNYGFLSGDFAQYTGPTYTPGAVTDRIFVRVTVPVLNAGNAIMQISNIAVSNHSDLFDGDTPNSPDAITAWSGTRYNSRSNLLTRRVRNVIAGRNHQDSTLTPAGYASGATFAEFFCQVDAENPSLRLVPQDITSNRGLYFCVDALGIQNFDGDALDNTAVQAVAKIELLDVNGAVLSTFTGTPVTLALNVSTALATDTNTTKSVFVQVPDASIPTTATQARGVVSMINSLRGTGVALSRIMLLDEPVSSDHLHRLAYWDGDSGDDYFWNGAANDSTSAVTANLPVRWDSTDSGFLDEPGLVSVKGAPGPDGSPIITLTTPIHSGVPDPDDSDPTVSLPNPAGHYLFGLQVCARVEPDDVGSAIPSAVTVQAQFFYSDALVNTSNTSIMAASVGTDFSYVNIQGGVDVVSQFDEIRFVIKASAAAPVLFARVRNVYLYFDNGAVTVQHLNVNRIQNADLRNTAAQWTLTGGTATPNANDDIVLSSGAALLSRIVGTPANSTIHLAIWARIGITPKITWYTAQTGGTVVSTVTLPAITQPDYTTISAGSYVVPATANAALITLTSTNSTAEARYVYLGLDYSLHDADGYYDPLVFPYFDGSTPDYNHSPTQWSGDQFNSGSQVVPSIVAGWVTSATNVHQVVPRSRPIGSTGRAAGLVKVAKNSTQTYRTIGTPRDGNTFLSGQISVLPMPGANVTISLYQASSATASATGSALFTRNVASTGEIVVWNNLPLTSAYVYLQVTYTETVNAPGYRVWLDNLALIMTTVALGLNAYPGYFDGNQGGGQWLGAPSASISQYYGGGRRAYAEVVDAIDMSSMAGGTRAEFGVALVIPGSFWEDLTMSTVEVDLTNGQLLAGQEFDLDALIGGTAPISDALITLDIIGVLTDLVIEDMATGGWLKISGDMPASITVDNGNFTVTDGTGASLITRVTRGGSNQLVPIVPVTSTAPPRLKISAADTSTGQCSVTVVARRRYLVA
jgi:hypothetical protein